MTIRCDKCGQQSEVLYEVNPERGFDRPHYVMCGKCLQTAPEGSYAAAVYETICRNREH